MVEAEQQGNEELPEEEAGLGGKSSTEHDTEAEALEIMGVPVLDDATEHEALEAYAEEAERDEDLQQDGQEVKDQDRHSDYEHPHAQTMQIGELSLERRSFIAMKEMCEDSDEERGLQKTTDAKSKPLRSSRPT